MILCEVRHARLTRISHTSAHASFHAGIISDASHFSDDFVNNDVRAIALRNAYSACRPAALFVMLITQMILISLATITYSSERHIARPWMMLLMARMSTRAAASQQITISIILTPRICL